MCIINEGPLANPPPPLYPIPTSLHTDYLFYDAVSPKNLYPVPTPPSLHNLKGYREGLNRAT